MLLKIFFILLESEVVVVIIGALSEMPVPATDVASLAATLRFLVRLKASFTVALAILALYHLEYHLRLTGRDLAVVGFYKMKKNIR